MCLVLFAWQVLPEFPLVVAANRDEFFARPTRPAEFWPDAPTILAGRDQSAGGTWMGLTRQGRFSALTNFRAPEQTRSDRPSRGTLVADFLRDRRNPGDYLASTADFGQGCNGYNLLAGTVNPCSPAMTLWWCSNVSGERKALLPGVYGLSNHLLDTPWPKVDAGRVALAEALSALLQAEPDDQALFALLRDSTRHPDQHLPATGVPLEWERALSAAFIQTEGYGTRSSTVLRVDAGGTAWFDEQTWLPGAGAPVYGPRRRFRFRLS